MTVPSSTLNDANSVVVPLKAGGVGNRARADHARRRKTRDPRGDLGHRVDRVGRDQQDRVRCSGQDLGQDVGEHRGVALEQVEPALARALAEAGRQDHRARAFEVRIVARPDAADVGERRRVQDVLGLGQCAPSVLVDQHDLARGAAEHQRIRGGAADHASTDDAHFHDRSSRSVFGARRAPIRMLDSRAPACSG